MSERPTTTHSQSLDRRAHEVSMGELKEIIESAVRAGISDALTEQNAEHFWKAGLSVLQKQAAQHAGAFVLGGVAGLLKKALLFITLGAVVYALGGWTALVGLFKTLFIGSGT